MLIKLYLYLFLFLCLFLYIIWKRRKFYLLTLKIPGPLGYPIIGMAHKLRPREDILTGLNKFEKMYGSLFYSWLGPTPVIVVVEPQFVQDILNSQHCVNKGIMYNAVRDSSGDGLFVLKQPIWSQHRKLMNPAFSHKRLLNSFSTFNEESDKLVQIFGEHCGHVKISVMRILQEYTISLSTLTTSGFNLDCNQGDNLIDGFECCLDTATQMIFSPWLMFSVVRMIFGHHWKYEKLKRHIDKFLTNLIDEKIVYTEIEQLNNQKLPETHNFLDLAVNLLRKGDFTYKNVLDESKTIFIGAFETTSNTIANTLILLAMFPEYQQKLFEEILSFYPEQKNICVTVQEIQQMVYLDIVINEVLRVMPAVPLIAREVSSDVKLSNGITLPTGLQIAIDIFNMHRSTEIWGPEAHMFNPENFLPTNLEGKHSYAYIPFAKGIRNCIGWRYALLSIKVVIVKLLRNYHFKTDFKFEDLVFVEGITLKLKETPMLELVARVD